MIPEEADDDEEAQEIPLPNVKSHVLSKVIEFCRRYAEEPMSEIEKPLKSANMFARRAEKPCPLVLASRGRRPRANTAKVVDDGFRLAEPPEYPRGGRPRPAPSYGWRPRLRRRPGNLGVASTRRPRRNFGDVPGPTRPVSAE